MSDLILKNLQSVHKRIRAACEQSHRNPDDIRLLLATKTVDTDKILFALAQGENLIGENKVQELKKKCSAIKRLYPEVHFIGHLQTNKIKDVIKWATCIESIDRLKLAEKLHDRLVLDNKTMNVYIQVNTSYEESKFGVAPKKALELIRQVAEFDTLKIRGLMTIGLFSAESEKVRRCYKLLKDLQLQAQNLDLRNVEMRELSMGMSGDLEIAIEEGATIVRVGTAIFGERLYPDSYYWNEDSKVL